MPVPTQINPFAFLATLLLPSLVNQGGQNPFGSAPQNYAPLPQSGPWVGSMNQMDPAPQRGLIDQIIALMLQPLGPIPGAFGGSGYGTPAPIPLQLASALSRGKPGVVLDPRDRGEERLYGPTPTQQQLDRDLERFHRGTPAERWKIENIGDIDENFRRASARYFTG